MTKIKICGLSRAEDIQNANDLRPDYIGWMFYEKSKRHVSFEEASARKAQLSADIRCVGVFVDAPLSHIMEAVRLHLVDLIQLHGAEDEDMIRMVQKQTALPVIKAFRVETKEDVRAAQRSPADYILFDHGSGGTGKVFDWSLIRDVNKPFFLAGGLHADNVVQAIGSCHPYAVDVSSGVETDGKKDAEKMRRFVGAVRRADEDGAKERISNVPAAG